MMARPCMWAGTVLAGVLARLAPVAAARAAHQVQETGPAK